MPFTNATILVVDDEPMIRGMQAECLRSEGLNVIEAASPHEARESLTSAGDIDVAVIDVDLKSSVDGYELSAELRGLRPTLQTIFASGGDVPRALPANSTFLEKPFTIGRLLTTVENALSVAATSGHRN